MRSKEEVLQLVRKFAGYEDKPEYVKLRDDGMVEVAGIPELSFEELTKAEEEKIKERLRAMGYLASKYR